VLAELSTRVFAHTEFRSFSRKIRTQLTEASFTYRMCDTGPCFPAPCHPHGQFRGKGPSIPPEQSSYAWARRFPLATTCRRRGRQTLCECLSKDCDCSFRIVETCPFFAPERRHRFSSQLLLQCRRSLSYCSIGSEFYIISPSFSHSSHFGL